MFAIFKLSGNTPSLIARGQLSGGQLSGGNVSPGQLSGHRYGCYFSSIFIPSAPALSIYLVLIFSFMFKDFLMQTLHFVKRGTQLGFNAIKILNKISLALLTQMET